jgi:hypothetical protein
MWQLWRVTLPDVSSSRFDSWAEAVGVEAVEPAWGLRFGSIPDSFCPDRGIPIFQTRKTLIATLEAPGRGARADVKLSTGSGAISSDSFSLAPGSYDGFVAFSVAWPGSNELSVGYDQRSVLRFETEEAEDLSDLKRALARVSILKVSVGDAVVSSWGEPFEIAVPRRDKEAPKIALRPDFEELRVGLLWKIAEVEEQEEELSVSAATRRLNAFFELRRDVDVRVDAGAMGSVNLRFRVPLVKK